MVGPFNLRDLAWAIAGLLRAVLLLLVLHRRLYRIHPVFSIYVLMTVTQALISAWAAHQWGTKSMAYFNIAWGVQALVIGVRWLAVMEIARRTLADYRGIWRLAGGLLLLSGVASLVYALAIPHYAWNTIILNADRAVELCIAVFVVGMLFFIRYYRLAMTSLERQLSIGFGLYSCFWVASNSIFQGTKNASPEWWQFFGILAFLATLLIWIDAVRRPMEVLQSAPAPALTPDQYGEFSQQLNVRLHVLDDRLNHLLRSEDSRS